MRKNLIHPSQLAKWAAILLDHSLGGIKSGMRVMIKGEAVSWPLMAELEAQIIAAGGIPDVYLVPPNNDRGRVWSAAMATFGRPEQFSAIPDWHHARYASMDAYIEILGTDDPTQFNFLDPEKAGLLSKADAPFREIRCGKPWVLTLYPTVYDAQSEGFSSLEDYAEFLVQASLSDPNAMKTAQEALTPIFQSARSMTVHTKAGRGGILELRIGFSEDSHPVICCGERNWPDGEYFRSPDPRLTEGEILLDLPVTYNGVTIRGIYLKFVEGKVVDYSAQEGGEALRSIIETDEGSRRLGEAALGMNPGLTRVLKNPLYVEKVGGTIHIALGMSYEQCYSDPEAAKRDGSFNPSAQHVDLVCDFRKDGAGANLWLDDTLLVVKDGQWVVDSSVP